MRTRPSIRTRLAVSYAALSLVLFGAMAGFVYWIFDKQLDLMQAEETRGLTSVVEHLLADAAAGRDLGFLDHRLDDVRLGHRGLHIWVEGTDGDLLYGDSPFPTAIAADDIQDLQLLQLTDAKREPGILRSIKAPLDQQYSRLAIVVELTEQRELSRLLFGALVAALAMGSALAAILGLVIADRAMRPIRRFSELANSITSTSISERLPADDVNAEIYYFVISFNNVLDRIEEALRQHQGFSADVAHELNTPLATLIAGTELALAADSDADRLRETLAYSLEDLHRLEGIVRDMLFLARADQGATALRSPATDVYALIADVIEYYDAVLTESGLKATIQGNCTADVDGPLFKRAIANLLSNAVRFAARDSTITVSIVCGDGQMTLTVSNRGEPVSAEKLDRLFDRFYRADQARANSDQHHGLGLAIVRAVAKMHSGRCFATSRDGVTAFGIEIPRVSQANRGGRGCA